MENQNTINYIKSKKGGLPCASDEELLNELERRAKNTPFPLHVFHENIQPFINALVKEYDLPRAYVGSVLLSAYSTAIGTGAHLKTSLGNQFLCTWLCIVGASSSGKSVTINNIYAPFERLGKEMEDAAYDSDDPNDKNKTVLFRDSHIATLVRAVLPCNPKGLTRTSDEILEWINSMNQGNKRDTIDEQFWISTWSCLAYKGYRANQVVINIKHPFVNIVGGIQPSLLPKLFENNRDKSGMVYRILFAKPPVMRIPKPNMHFKMPEDFKKIHSRSIEKLYRELFIGSWDVMEYSRKIHVSKEAMDIYLRWKEDKQYKLDHTKMATEDYESKASMFGKFNEYCLRFAGILQLADISYDDKREFDYNIELGVDVMRRAIELADYFYLTADYITFKAKHNATVPDEVLRYAVFFKQGLSYQDIGNREFGQLKITDAAKKKKAERNIKRFIKKYPRQFNANAS